MEKYILTFVRGSGSVWVHLSTILRVQVGSDSLKQNFAGSGSVRVHQNETVHSGLRFGFRFGSTPWTQGSRPRPSTQKKSEAKESLSEDRHSRRQGQECSRPMTKDTSASALQKKHHKNLSGDLQKKDKNFSGDLKKKVFTKIFQVTSTKKRFPKNFSDAPYNFNNSKNSAVFEPRTG